MIMELFTDVMCTYFTLLINAQHFFDISDEHFYLKLHNFEHKY